MNHAVRALFGQVTGLMTIALLSSAAMAQSVPETPSVALIRPQRQTLLYPGPTSAITITDPVSTAKVTLNVGQREDGIVLNLVAASLPDDRCALVSVQTPPSLASNNDQMQLVTTPISFVPLSTKPGYCGAVSTYQQNPVAQPSVSSEALVRTAGLSGLTKIPFTLEVFFVPLWTVK